MQGIQAQIQTLQDTLKHLNDRRAEVKQQIQALRQQQAQQPPTSSSSSGSPSANPWTAAPPPPKAADPLEVVFQQWETDLELEDLKRQMQR
jgi:hypothetical protein